MKKKHVNEILINQARRRNIVFMFSCLIFVIFLISLSLALALSDIGRGLSLDILFIDEGFGTLSKDVLQTAIETLGVLHKTLKKNVGIISHVEELQERIPVQIKVQQEGNTSSSMVSVLEN